MILLHSFNNFLGISEENGDSGYFSDGEIVWEMG